MITCQVIDFVKEILVYLNILLSLVAICINLLAAYRYRGTKGIFLTWMIIFNTFTILSITIEYILTAKPCKALIHIGNTFALCIFIAFPLIWIFNRRCLHDRC